MPLDIDSKINDKLRSDFREKQNKSNGIFNIYYFSVFTICLLFGIFNSLFIVNAKGLDWFFNVDGDLKGWNQPHDMKNIVVSGGSLNASVTGTDPFIYSPTTNIDASVNKYVEVKMKNNTSSNKGQIYWISNSDGTYGENKVINFDIKPNDKDFSVYTIDLSKHAKWSGTIAGLRLDPTRNVSKGSVNVAYIKVYGISTNPDSNDDSNLPIETDNSNLNPYVNVKNNWVFDVNGDFKGWKQPHDMKDVIVSGGSLNATITGTDPFIYSPTTNIDSSVNKYIEVKMKNNTSSNKGQIYWISNLDGTYGENKVINFDIKANDKDFSVYTIDLSKHTKWNGTITGLRLDPTRNISKGVVSIAYIKVSTINATFPTNLSWNIKCTINSDRSSVNITGNINMELESMYVDSLDSYLIKNTGLKIRIYELEPNENEETINFASRRPLTEQEFSSNFVFKFPLLRPDGKHSRLYSKFVPVLVNKSNKYSIISLGQYITNPERLTINNYPFTYTNSIKGLQVQMIDDAKNLGVKHAALNLAIHTLLYNSNKYPTKTIVYNFEGKNYYFNKQAVETFDKKVKELTDNGVEVSAILLVYKTTDKDLLPINKILIHPDSKGGTIYAVNTKTAAGIEYYKAIISFLSQRYSREDKMYGRIMNYIVGNEINSNQVWNNMGKKSLTDYIKEYERTLRLTNTIVKSNCANARVNISLDHNWTGINGVGDFGGKSVIDALNEYIINRGNFDWNIAYHPYPENLFDPAFWNDSTAINSFDTQKITFKNIDILVKYIQQSQFLFNNNKRHIILSEQGFNSGNNSNESQEIQAAAYAYAFYKIKFLPDIDAFILHRHVDHAKEGGLNLGLWTNKTEEINTPDTKKHIYDVFKYIDTDRSLEVTNFAKSIIGIRDWKDVIPNFDVNKLNDNLVN